ncbi:MAG: hypothetical protein KBG15_21465 [Kofleriaceae bacterium]|nr:hypothetical protein [Kofleriaceae bacterium]
MRSSPRTYFVQAALHILWVGLLGLAVACSGKPVRVAAWPIPAVGPGQLLAYVPAGAQLLVEIDVARLRANPVVGALVRRFVDAATPVTPGVPLPPGLPTSLRGVDAIVIASFMVGAADAQTLTLLRVDPTHHVAGVGVGAGVVAVGPENLIAQALLLGNAPSGAARGHQLSAALVAARQRIALPGTDGSALRITATLSTAAAAALGVPPTLAVWSDVVDDAAILISCPRASVDALAQRLRQFEQNTVLRLLGLAPSLAQLRVQHNAPWARIIVVIAPGPLRRAVQRASATLGTTVDSPGMPVQNVPQSSQGAVP